MSITTLPILAGVIESLHWFVTAYKVHPILVNFTAALVPVSIGADIVARIFKTESIRATAWWTLLLAACITPFTAIAGWLFWMDDDIGVTGMTIHKWLGTGLAVGLVALIVWRWLIYRKDRWPSIIYMVVGVLVVGALTFQGHLGGDQSFGSMEDQNAAAPMKMTQPAPSTTPSAPATTTSSIQWRPSIDLKGRS